MFEKYYNQAIQFTEDNKTINKYPFYGFVGNKKVLLTGSGWFKHIPSGCTNVSQIIAEKLHGTIIEGAEVISVILPNMWDSSINYIEEAIKKIKPILMISVGTDNTPDIRLEKYATNLAYGIDYSDPPKIKGSKHGKSKQYEKISEDGPDFYETILPEGVSIEYLINILLNNGIPSVGGDKIFLSDSKKWISTAGYYLCNYFSYNSLKIISSQKLPIKYLFIHTPSIPKYRTISLLEKKEITPSMDIELIINGIQIVIANILQSLRY